MTNNDFITVKIDRQTLLDMLGDRLDFWPASSYVESPKEKQLFMDMYESSIDAGCFDGCELDPTVIVDNDVVNYCSVIDKADVPAKDWRRIVKLWHDGERDISCEDAFSFGHPSFIEAMNEEDGLCLIRW